MSKKKKIKWKNLPSTFRTAIIGMAIFLVIGLGLLIYGLVFGKVSSDDIHTVQAEIVSIDKVSRNLSTSQEEDLRKNGISEDSIKYELKIVYKYNLDGTEYQYTGREQYDKADRLKPGDKTDLKYAMVNGKPEINPDSNSTFVVFGVIIMILGVLSGLVAFIIRPKR
jgi:hypothetical protein